VGFSAIDLLVGFTGGANARFEFFNEPKGKAFLLSARPFAEGTFKALFGLPAVLLGNSFVLHNFFLLERNPPNEFRGIYFC